MCNNNTVWSSSDLCGFQFGGKCINDTCICNDGYQHDFTILRQRDCSLHYMVMPVISVYLLVTSTFNLVNTIIIYRNSISLSKILLLLNIFFITSSISLALFYLSNLYVINSLGLFIYLVLFSSSLSTGYIMVFSIASPLFKMAEMNDDKLKKWLIYLFYLFRLSNVIVFIILSVISYDAVDDAQHDHEWNVIISVASATFGIETLALFATIQIISRRMIKTVKKLISLTPDNPNHATTRQYLEKITLLMTNLFYFDPIAGLIFLAIPVVYFSTQYMPCTYIIISSVLILTPLLQHIISAYAKRERLKVDQQQQQHQQQLQVHHHDQGIGVRNSEDLETLSENDTIQYMATAGGGVAVNVPSSQYTASTESKVQQDTQTL